MGAVSSGGVTRFTPSLYPRNGGAVTSGIWGLWDISHVVWGATPAADNVRGRISPGGNTGGLIRVAAGGHPCSCGDQSHRPSQPAAVDQMAAAQMDQFQTGANTLR